MAARSTLTPISPIPHPTKQTTLIVLTVGFVAMLACVGFPRFGYSILLPEMRAALSLTYAQTGAIATVNFISYMILTLLGGFAVARLGSPLILLVTMPLMGAAMIALGIAGRAEVVLLGYAVAGAGGGIATIAATSLPARWASMSNRGRFIGLVGSGTAFGQLSTGFVLPVIIGAGGTEGWRLGWYLLGGFTVVSTIPAVLLLRYLPPDTRGSHGSRLSDMRSVLGRSPALWWLTAEGLFEGMSFVTYTIFFAAYLSGERQVSLTTTGQLWMLNGALATAGGFLTGTFSDRVDRRFALAACVLTKGMSYTIFALSGGLPGFVVGVILNGLIGSGGLIMMTGICTDHFGSRLGPAAVGIANFGFAVGAVIGPIVAGYLADTTGSFVLPLLLSTGLAVGAAVCALLVPRTPAYAPGMVT